MKRLLRLLAAATAVAAIAVTPAGAVIGGSPDGNAHPYVGLSAFFAADGTFIQRCSGFLVSPTVYVTAGHCAGQLPGRKLPVFARIWFNSGPVSSRSAPDAVGIPVPSPGWTGVLPEHDIGVVRLTQPVTAFGYASLAPVGYLDSLAKQRGRQDVELTVVGYGVQEFGPLGFTAIPTRFVGEVQLEHLTDIDLFTTASPGNGTGGGATCEGDSGGPVLSDGYVVALTSAGTKYCNGKSAAFRLDTVEAQSFIAAF